MGHRKPIQDRFAGKVARIIGGSAGIGRATANEFCCEGVSVVFTDLELSNRPSLKGFACQSANLFRPPSSSRLASSYDSQIAPARLTPEFNVTHL